MADERPQPRSSNEVTRLLARWRDGDEQALEALLPEVYDELRRVAVGAFGRERGNHTLQPTAVLHEAYLRLVGPGASFQNRAHFFAAAANAIRRVLIDHARRRNAGKRPSSGEQITLVESPRSESMPAVDVLALHEALEKLEATDARKARVVELSFFGGMTGDEIATTMNLSLSTVNREWRLARMMLGRWLEPPLG